MLYQLFKRLSELCFLIFHRKRSLSVNVGKHLGDFPHFAIRLFVNGILGLVYECRCRGIYFKIVLYAIIHNESKKKTLYLLEILYGWAFCIEVRFPFHYSFSLTKSKNSLSLVYSSVNSYTFHIRNYICVTIP